MAVNTVFAEKLALVSGAPSIAFVSNDTGHAELTYSYVHDGGSPGTYTVTSSSELGCEMGAANLLYALGFRFYAPHEDFHVIPAGPLATNLTASNERMTLYANTSGQTYGHSFPAPHDASRTVLNGNVGKWCVLNGWRDNNSGGAAFSNGHRWTGITRTTSSGPLRQFFIDNPQLLIDGDLDSFDLENLTRGSPDYELLTDYCASFLLNAGFNYFGTTNMDASDGDANPSSVFYQFTVDVCVKCRAGVSSLGGAALPLYGLITKAGVSNARLGVYSYAGHKNAPEYDISPYVYVGVALGFAPPSGFAARIEQFGGVADLVMTRDYHDTHTWTYGRPLINNKVKSNYADTYAAYIASGLTGVHTESSGNWLINIVAFHQFNQWLKAPGYTYAQARNDVVGDIFDDDPAVHDIYDYWGDPNETFHEFSLEQSCVYVDAMAEGWYKEMFKWTMVICYEYLTLPEKPAVPSVGDVYDVALSKLLAHTTAMRDYDITHSYAWLRRLARGNVSADYPHLQFEVDPKPSFYTDPYLPDDDDYTAVKSALAASNFRADGIDPSDTTELVVMHGITPVNSGGAATPAATKFNYRYQTTYYFVGPGTVTVSGVVSIPGEGDADPTEEEYNDPQYYGAGLHVIHVNGTLEVTCDTGLLFCKVFPDSFRDNTSEGENWAYVPTRCADQVRVKATSNLRLIDQNGPQNFSTEAQGVDQSIGPGQVRLDDTNSSGWMALVNMSPYVSLQPTKQLLAREIAEEDFPVIGKILKA